MNGFAVNIDKPQARQRKIWRFVVLSTLVHALFGMFWLNPGTASMRLPAPELAVALSEIAVQPGTRARTSANVPLATRSISENVFDNVSDVSGSPAQDHNIAERGDEQRRNHLQSLLRAAFEAQFVYPSLARRQGWQGRVQIALRVEADGRFSDLRVLQSSGHASLDHNALQTLQRIGQLAQARLWLDGRAMRVELPVIYRLLES